METPNPPLTPVRKQALSDAVFEQLRSRIVSGELAAGSPLPAERVLCEALGVNRSSVREALRRLEQARLVSIRHGGTSRILDYRESAGLDLLPALVMTGDGRIDATVVRGILEMRSAIAADAARLAAAATDQSVKQKLVATCAAMRAADGELTTLQDLAIDYWSAIVDASGNIAYRLAYNSLRDTYDTCRAILASALADELCDADGYTALADAIGSGDAKSAEALARQLVQRGEMGIKQVLDALDSTAVEKQ